VQALVEAVVRLRVWIEAAIDFPEEEIDFLAAPQLLEDLVATCDRLDDLLAASRRGVRLADGLHVVIVGRPNAGKSSLLNALAASDRAIVTDLPGTTRDLLRETIDLDGIGMTLVDTAGLRDSLDAVEIEGMRRARDELARADLAILVNTDAQLERDLPLLAELPATTTRLTAHNQIALTGGAPRQAEIDGLAHIWLSARSGAGLDLLMAALRKAAGYAEDNQGAFSARARHVDAIERARQHLHAALHALREQRAGELAAEELRQVQHALGEITGKFSSEDL